MLASEAIGVLSGIGSVSLNANTLTVNVPSNGFSSGAAIGGTGGVVYQGSGEFGLFGASTYSGPTTIDGPQINISGNTSLGSTADGTTILSGMLLLHSNGMNVAEPLILTAEGGRGYGVLENYGGSNTWSGSITLNASSSIGTTFDANNLTVTGAIGGVGGLTVRGQSGAITTLSGANTYGGSTTVPSGVVLRIGASGAIPDGSALTVAGTFNVNGFVESVGSLAGGGSVLLGTGSALTTGGNNTSTTFSGAVGGTGGQLTKTGSGSMSLTGSSAGYTGTTTVNGGTLLVNGSIAGSAVTVQTDAAGHISGTTGPLTIDSGGFHKPGNSPGITTVNGDYIENGTLEIEFLNHTGAAGAGYDQVQVIGGGSVTLGGSSLLTVPFIGTAGTFNPAGAQVFIIIDNDGTGPGDLTGTFSNAAAGDTFTVDGKSLKLYYFAGDGNDVALVSANGAPTTLYVDDSFTTPNVMVDGNKEAAGLQSAYMGIDAFASIEDALAAYPGFNGTIVVNGGTYASASLAGGGNVTLQLAKDGAADVTIQSLSGDAGDSIATHAFGTANLIVESGSFSGVISGGGTLLKTTAGTLTLNGSNTYSGTTTVLAGTLAAGVDAPNGAAGAFGNATSAVVLGDTSGAVAATIAAGTGGGNVTIGRSITVVAGSSGTATLTGNVAGASDAVFSGAITLSKDLAVHSVSGLTTFSGAISGTGFGVTKTGAAMIFSGSGSNTYSGTTTVDSGLLVLSKSGGAIAVPGDLVVNASGEAVRLGANEQIADTALVTLNAGVFNLLASSETIGNLTGTGMVDYGATGVSTFTVGDATNRVFAGTIAGSVAADQFVKAGAGTLTLSGSNTFSGITQVNAGTLLVNGANNGTGAVNVNNAAILGGTGSIAGPVNLNGTSRLAPGASPETLATGAVTFTSGTFFEVEIGGTSPGDGTTGYDQLVVTGTVALGGATLNLIQFAGFTANNAVQQTFTIIDNDGSADLVTGTFAGLPEGSQIDYAGGTVFISYAGGDGNDVVLYSQPVVNGSPGADTLVLRRLDASFNEFSLNGAAFVPITNAFPFAFNGLGGTDLMLVDTANGDPIPTGNASFTGEILRIQKNGGAATESASYTPTAITIVGFGDVSFTGTSNVDFVNLVAVDVRTAAVNDTLSIADGATATNGGTVPGGYSIAAAADLAITGAGTPTVGVRNVTTLTLNTITGGGDGNDTVNLGTTTGTSAGVTNLGVNTGVGSDVINVNGPLAFSGDVSLTSGGNIVDGNAGGTDITAATVSFLASTGIAASGNPLEVDAGTFTTVQTATGGIFIDIHDVGNVTHTVTSASATTSGDIVFTSTVGGGSNVNVFQSVVAANGNISLSRTTTGNIEANAIAASTAGRTIDIHAGEGDITHATGTIQTNSGAITFTSDRIHVAALVNAGTAATNIRTFTNARPITFGITDTAGTMGLTDAELDRITAGAINIGVATTGPLVFNLGISPGSTSVLNLVTGANVDDNHAGREITIPTLSIVAGTGIGSPLAAQQIEISAITFTNLQSATGGIHIAIEDVGDVSHTVQSASATTSGDIVFTSVVGGGTNTIAFASVVAANGNIDISRTTGGDLEVLNLNASNTAGRTITVTAQGVEDSIVHTSGAIQTTNAAIHLVADQMSLVGGTIAAGNGTVTLRPFNNSQAIDLGSTPANTLGLTDAALDTITASTIQVGDSNSGAVAVSAAIAPANATNLTVTNGVDLLVSEAATTTGAINFNFGQGGTGSSAVLSGALTGTTANVTGGSGQDTITVNTVSATTTLVLDAASDDDAYIVNHGPWSGTVSIVENGNNGNDTATLYGTSGVDAFNINSATPNAVHFGSPADETVNFNANLEQLTISGPAFPGDGTPSTPTEADAGDTFLATPDAETLISIHGGNPTNSYGDTLILNALGLTTPVITPSPARPDGQIASGNRQTLNWTSIETLPVPLGLGGTFDFQTGTSSVQPGFLAVRSNDTPTSGNYAFADVGWVNPGAGAFDRFAVFGAAGNPNSPQLVNLLRDGEWGYAGGGSNNGVFQVRVAPNENVAVTAYIGDTYAARDMVNVYVQDSTNPASRTKLNPTIATFNTIGGPHQYVSYTGMFKPTTGILHVIVETEWGGSSAFWTISGLDVRPEGLIAPLAITRTGSTDGTLPAAASLPGDGFSIDSYAGTGAAPFATLTINPQHGTPTGTDADVSVKGHQVVADIDGAFTFTIRRPTGTGPSTVTVTDVIGESGTGNLGATAAGPLAVSPNPFALISQYSQTYDLQQVRRLDFGPSTSPVVTPSGPYIGWSNGAYVSTASNALGWVNTTPTAFDRGTGNDLQRDGVYGNGPAEFRLDMPTANASYAVTALLGDAVNAQNGMYMQWWNGATWVTPPTATGINTPAGQSTSVTFEATSSGTGVVRLRVGNDTTNANAFWTLQSLEVRPSASTVLAGAQTRLTVNGTLFTGSVTALPGTVDANGTTSTAYAITGAAPNSLLTVTTTLGTITTADAGATYTGIQALTDGSGAASFHITSPFSTTALTGTIAVTDTTGGSTGTFTQSYAGVAPPASPPPPATSQRFDFNLGSSPTLASPSGFLGVQPSDTYTTNAGYGWKTAVYGYDRGNGTGGPPTELYRDGAWGFGSGTFQIGVTAGASRDVRLYYGDPYTAWSGLSLQVEGSLTAPVNVDPAGARYDYMNTVPPAGFDVPLIVPEPSTTPKGPNGGPGGGPGPPPMPS